MTAAMSRRTGISKLSGPHSTNDVQLSLEGVSLYTDRSEKPVTSHLDHSHVSPRRHARGAGQVSVIQISPGRQDVQISPRRQDTLRGSVIQISPRRKNTFQNPLRPKLHREEKSSHGGKGQQMSILELQSLTTSKKKALHDDQQTKAEWLQPKRPSFLPPLDMSQLYSRSSSPESEIPETPRCISSAENTPRSDNTEDKHIARQTYPLTYAQNGGSSNNKIHMDIHRLTGQRKMINGNNNLKYGKQWKKLEHEENNDPDDESRPITNRHVVKPKINLDEIITPRDILHSDAYHHRLPQTAAHLQPPKNFRLFNKEKLPSGLLKAETSRQPTKSNDKLPYRKTEGRKLLRFKVESNIVKGRQNEPVLENLHVERADMNTADSGSCINMSFSRPSTTLTEQGGAWHAVDDEIWDGNQDQVERWWDTPH